MNPDELMANHFVAMEGYPAVALPFLDAMD